MERIGRRLALGIALGLLISALLAVVLHGVGAAGGEPVEEAGAESAVAEYLLPAEIPRGEAFLIYVAAPGHELPERVAPVVVVGPGGSVRVARGAPTPDAPEAGPWIAAGVILPGPEVAELDPGARAALLTLWRTWRGTLGRGSSWRVVPIGIRDPAAISVLGRWER